MADARRDTLRPVSGWVLLIGSAALTTFFLGDVVLRAGVVEAALIAPWLLLVVWGVYVIAFASSVSMDASGLRVQNFLRITEVPWHAMTDVDLYWQLQIHLRDGSVLRCYGGPVGRRPRVRRGTAAPVAPLRSADADVDRIRDRMLAATEGRPTDAEGRPMSDAPGVRRRWDAIALVSGVVLVVWAVAAVVITGGPSL